MRDGAGGGGRPAKSVGEGVGSLLFRAPGGGELQLSTTNITRVVALLDAAGHNGPISEKQAVAASKRVQAAAAQTEPEMVLPADGSVNPGNGAQFAHHTQTVRAAQSGVGRRTQQKLDRLARERPE